MTCFQIVVLEISFMILNCISVKLQGILCVLCFLPRTPESRFPVLLSKASYSPGYFSELKQVFKSEHDDYCVLKQQNEV